MAAGEWKPKKTSPEIVKKNIIEAMRRIQDRKAKTSHGKRKEKKGISHGKENNIMKLADTDPVQALKVIQRFFPVRNAQLALLKRLRHKSPLFEERIQALEKEIERENSDPLPLKLKKKRGRPANPLWYWNYGKVQKKGKKSGADNNLYKNYLKEQMLKAAKKWEGVEPGHGRSCKRK